MHSQSFDQSLPVSFRILQVVPTLQQPDWTEVSSISTVTQLFLIYAQGGKVIYLSSTARGVTVHSIQPITDLRAIFLSRARGLLRELELNRLLDVFSLAK